MLRARDHDPFLVFVAHAACCWADRSSIVWPHATVKTDIDCWLLQLCWHASEQKHNVNQTILRIPLALSKTLCLDRGRWVPPARTGIAQSTAASTTRSSYGIYPDQELRKPGNENQHESQCWLMKEQLVVGRFMKSKTPCRARSICMK
jgi:hypothetical protein